MMACLRAFAFYLQSAGFALAVFACVSLHCTDLSSNGVAGSGPVMVWESQPTVATDASAEASNSQPAPLVEEVTAPADADGGTDVPAIPNPAPVPNANGANDGGSLLDAATEGPFSNDDAQFPFPPDVIVPDIEDGGRSLPQEASFSDMMSPEASTWHSICLHANGSALSYDHTRGIVEEYALDLSTDCSLGGYLAPLIAQDPINYSAIMVFNGDLTDWLRVSVLQCGDRAGDGGLPPFGLLPAMQSADMSRKDFEASISLFIAVMGRHDNRPDGIGAANRAELHRRLKTFAQSAVKQESTDPTKPLPPSTCAPTPG